MQEAFLSSYALAGNRASASLVQRWREESARTDLRAALLQRLTYERGYGGGSWEGWTGPWRDEAAQTLWEQIDDKYNVLRQRIQALDSEASGVEKAELESVAATLDALDANPVVFQQGHETLATLLERGEQLKAIETAIEIRRAAENAPIEEVEEATQESNNLHHLFAAGLLAGVIAWQTYQDRQGKQTGGRGARAAAAIHELNGLFAGLSKKVEEGKQTVDEHLDSVNAALRVVRRPTVEGFLMGVDPLPMPVAQAYAPWRDIQNTFFRVVFLLTVGREQMDEYSARVTAFAIKSGGKKDDQQSDDGPTIKKSAIDLAVGKKNALAGGFAAGVATGSGVQGMLPVLSDPVMSLQGPWDAFHVLNDLAVRTEKQRQTLEGRQRQLWTYNTRIQAIYGRRVFTQLSPRALAYIRRLLR